MVVLVVVDFGKSCKITKSCHLSLMYDLRHAYARSLANKKENQNNKKQKTKQKNK